MSRRAAGSFEVTMSPQPPYHSDGSVSLGRVTVSKQFRGDLEGTSTVEMLTAMTGRKGSAGYVAIERVSGALHGRAGSFVLQHSGTMKRGEASLTVTVVPDSGTGALAGLAGAMTIDIVDGHHSYALDYTVAVEESV